MKLHRMVVNEVLLAHHMDCWDLDEPLQFIVEDEVLVLVHSKRR